MKSTVSNWRGLNTVQARAGFILQSYYLSVMSMPKNSRGVSKVIDDGLPLRTYHISTYTFKLICCSVIWQKMLPQLSMSIERQKPAMHAICKPLPPPTPSLQHSMIARRAASLLLFHPAATAAAAAAAAAAAHAYSEPIITCLGNMHVPQSLPPQSIVNIVLGQCIIIIV
jgi:hypothetical protein